MRRFLGLGAMVALVSAANASVSIVPATTSFIDISGTGTSVGSISDDSENTITTGWVGNELLPGGTCRVGNNGSVLWGADNASATDVGYINASSNLPAGLGLAGMAPVNSTSNGNGNGVRNMLAVLWDDNFPGSGASTKWQIIGSDLVIQWTNQDHFLAQGTGTITYELIAYGNRTIASGLPLVDFVYRDTSYAAQAYQNDGGSATIGFKDWIGGGANTVEYGLGGGDDLNGGDTPYGSPSMHPKVSGSVEGADSSLPHALSIIPEPTSLALLGLGAVALLRRR